MRHGFPRAIFPLLAAVCALAAVGSAAAEQTAAGELLAKLPGPTGTDVAFSRDGKLIPTAGGDEARVWDAQTYNPVTPALKHGAPVTAAVITPDGARVFTAAGSDAVAVGTAAADPARRNQETIR